MKVSGNGVNEENDKNDENEEVEYLSLSYVGEYDTCITVSPYHRRE